MQQRPWEPDPVSLPCHRTSALQQVSLILGAAHRPVSAEKILGRTLAQQESVEFLEKVMEDGTGKVIVNPLERWVRTTTGALRPATLPLQDQPCDERAWRLLLALEDAAQRARIQCDVYTDTTGAMVRFQQGPFEVYVNVSAPQRILTENEWIPRIGKTTKLPCLTTSYLENFIETSPKASARVKRRALDYLCRRHPNRMDYVAQRAVLCHQQGALSLALKDLRRFFAFYSESKAPRELVKLYRKLSSHLSGR